MKRTWTRYDVCDGYKVQFIAVSSDIMHIILYEHMTPIFQWELEEFCGNMYINNCSLEDAVEHDNASKVIDWVDQFINDTSMSGIVKKLINNPHLFVEPIGDGLVKYVYEFIDDYYAILTYHSSDDFVGEHLNVMFFKGDSPLSWTEFYHNGTQGSSDWFPTQLLSIESSCMERSLCNAITYLGTASFMTCLEREEDISEALSRNISPRVLESAHMTFTKVEMK